MTLPCSNLEPAGKFEAPLGDFLYIQNSFTLKRF
jgi:hypothetical protein